MDCALYDHAIGGAVAVVRCTSDPDPLWRTVVSLVTPILVLVSALIAWRSLRNTRSVARQKATIDLIEKVESTPHYRALATSFATVRRGDRFVALHDPTSDDDKKLRQDVLDYLNHYELVAIGIRHNILDDVIYRTWMQSHVVMEWNAASVFIQNERWRLIADESDYEYRAGLFGNLQHIVCKWSPDAFRLTADPKAKPALPNGPMAPGDLPLPPVDASSDA